MSLGELGNNAVKAVDDVIKNMEIPNKNPSESATGKGDLGSWRDVRDKIDDFQKTSPFENVSDATAKPLADSPLGKMSEGETFDKPMGEHDKPLETINENVCAEKADDIENKRESLTDDEKTRVKEEHPDWPDEIIDAIGSRKEYEIYNDANLKSEHINGKPCLVRTDIDMEQTDVKGRTNSERMKDGLAPLDKNGKPIELHHIGQKADAPLAELTFDEHHCGGNDSVLHDKKKETEVHGEGNNWDKEREKHWETHP